MATIYADQHLPLKELLAMAGSGADATLLIPDLQRPYVWSPSQVVVLVDSLIRGWPFGTLLTWKVKADDPARELARAFWTVVDRTGDDDGQVSGTKHPPSPFHMVLDGQQRVQSLLLAFGGDGWGFKLFDRQWHEQLSGSKPRGPRGRPHWSLGCLCVDVHDLCDAYAKTKSATAIDYTKILRWAVTDDAVGQSKLSKPPSYIEPLPKSSVSGGRYIRLARFWDKAPEQAGLDSYAAEDIANEILKEHGATEESRNYQKRPAGALIMALKDVKQTRVTYLELAGYDAGLWTREVYNDAVVNIFTRLNTAGRTLTREDITFAWLKIGWKTDCTENENARTCIETLAQQLDELSVPLSVEDVVSAISFVWSVSFNAGKLLNNDDLMKGEAIRPMAANISENWLLVTEAATQVCAQIRDRGLRFREQYQSVNALAYLWAWYFSALRWGDERNLKELEKDGLQKGLAATLDVLLDRWLICSQWAGVWASSSVQNLAGYATRLAACTNSFEAMSDGANVVSDLRQLLQSEVASIEQDAVASLSTMNADDRQQVRGYYTALWIWNRLDEKRWKMAKLALRQDARRKNLIEVDHVVAWDLWESKIAALAVTSPVGSTTSGEIVADEARSKVNELGNCMLLEKNFNISKSNHPLKKFLEEVHEFKTGELSLGEWAAALNLKMPQVDSANTPVDVLCELFAERSRLIRNDLEAFARGTKSRIDLDND